MEISNTIIRLFTDDRNSEDAYRLTSFWDESEIETVMAPPGKRNCKLLKSPLVLDEDSGLGKESDEMRKYTSIIEDTVPKETNDDDDDSGIHSQVGDIFTAPCAVEQTEECVNKVWEGGWLVVHYNSLPNWLRDNDFLHKGHRLPTNSFLACFRSIFRIHTETGNIWTHLIGMLAFMGITAYFVTRPSIEVHWQDKAVFSTFFVSVILCLGFSSVFHTVLNHSHRVGTLFMKLDYCGIIIQTMGTFVPWLYYGFYCRLGVMIIYMVLSLSLGISLCIMMSLWDNFSLPRFRVLRAVVFVAFGSSGVIPSLHFLITNDVWHAVHIASIGWLGLMVSLYIIGAIIYVVRIPERLFPGKFDLWFQSHQLMHLSVLAAMFVAYHGMAGAANYRLTYGNCTSLDY